MTNFHLANFGCRASQADGAALKRQLIEAGFREASELAEGDIAVLNTCTVTAAADAEVRQVVRRIQRLNPHCRILVTGCYAQRAPQEIAALDGVAWVVGNSHKHRIVEVLGSQVVSEPPRVGQDSPAGGHSRQSADHQPPPASPGLTRQRVAQVWAGEIGPDFHFAPALPDDRTRPTLKVQDGCNARCAFCVIPFVRGASRSLSPDRVVSEVQELVRHGFKEVVLSGINLGSYGRDLGRSVSFQGLVERILEETSVARVRISSIEPMDVTPSLIRLVARERRLADHFHVPLQSGCDRILRLMNRRYWTSQYTDRILAIREALPQAGIGADVMTGFPGETEQDHQASLEFISRLPLTYLHIFPYSSRPGTAAEARPEQVNGRVAHERADDLRALIAGKRQTFLEGQIGRTLSALTLADKGSESTRAITSNYLPVALPIGVLPPNTLAEVEVGRVAAGTLHAYPVRMA
ncbi:MAG TPA: tRNA (N(6)-L-threonylcarbamoyladenosine(37)-C(2))-methylthiotransferase MtaB [Terriglobia bacterium]|nr:tRNA (N(6)-L-threonylcarbamoyladenosine(37)-C(2))-methylthiotransferase MtaB [Terriglobia bacterium]